MAALLGLLVAWVMVTFVVSPPPPAAGRQPAVSLRLCPGLLAVERGEVKVVEGAVEQVGGVGLWFGSEFAAHVLA
jgi:hypothetical protein